MYEFFAGFFWAFRFPIVYLSPVYITFTELLLTVYGNHYRTQHAQTTLPWIEGFFFGRLFLRSRRGARWLAQRLPRSSLRTAETEDNVCPRTSDSVNL